MISFLPLQIKKVNVRFLIGILFLTVLISCQRDPKISKEGFDQLQGLGNTSLELSGKELTDLYCQACHVKPDPSLLDKATWEKGVLPDMRRRLGLITAEDFGAKVGEDNDAPPGIYSKTPLVTLSDWEKIQDFYISQAPEKLPAIPIDPNLDYDNILFSVRKHDFGRKRPSMTTLLRYHPEEKMLYLGDRLKSLYKFDPQSMGIQDSLLIISPSSDIRFTNKGFELLTMGVMDPSNYAFGKWEDYSSFDINKKEALLDSLRRPVHFSFADLNQNGQEDIVLSFFGNHIGSLSWFEKQGDEYLEHVLSSNPGARKTFVEDVNGDGLPDIIALITQAKEGIFVYINQGQGKFKEEKWLGFDSVHGSSDFEWVDMNGDGSKDLVMVNGDNADLSPILKPYHGLRIFTNDGNNSFMESYFYPMHGASAVVTGDFDSDGKPDIAVTSYFPDKTSERVINFLLFQQTTTGKFEVSTISELGQWSWLVMEKADIDADGDLDLILGNFDFKTQYAYPAVDWVPFLVLENQTR